MQEQMALLLSQQHLRQFNLQTITTRSKQTPPKPPPIKPKSRTTKIKIPSWLRSEPDREKGARDSS